MALSRSCPASGMASKYVAHCTRADRFCALDLEAAEALRFAKPATYRSILAEFESEPDPAEALARLVFAATEQLDEHG
jgi:hypothetical protein